MRSIVNQNMTGILNKRKAFDRFHRQFLGAGGCCGVNVTLTQICISNYSAEGGFSLSNLVSTGLTGAAWRIEAFLLRMSKRPRFIPGSSINL